MNRDETLSLWKRVTLDLRDNRINHDDIRLLKDVMKATNSCDADWVSSEYNTWFKKSIEPTLSPFHLDILHKHIK